MPYMDNDRDSTDVGDGWGVGSPLESGVSPAHIGPYHACHRAAPETTPLWTLLLQYVIEKWKPRQWEPSCNLPPEFPEKWELTHLGPGGLDSVFYLPCTV